MVKLSALELSSDRSRWLALRPPRPQPRPLRSPVHPTLRYQRLPLLPARRRRLPSPPRRLHPPRPAVAAATIGPAFRPRCESLPGSTASTPPPFAAPGWAAASRATTSSPRWTAALQLPHLRSRLRARSRPARLRRPPI